MGLFSLILVFSAFVINNHTFFCPVICSVDSLQTVEMFSDFFTVQSEHVCRESSRDDQLSHSKKIWTKRFRRIALLPMTSPFFPLF